MQQVTVIGGGFSGLAACLELERRGVSYLLIEVQRQVGGSLGSVQQGDFMLDTGAAAFTEGLPTDFLETLGLADQTFPVSPGVRAFHGGMGQLIAALSGQVRQARMMRTAVSSLGEIEGAPWGICLENGVLLSSQRVIVAAPARYAARMLRSALPATALQLAGWLYDDLVWLALAYPTAELPETVRFYRDEAYITHLRFEQTPRVPTGFTQFQVGTRLMTQHATLPALTTYLAQTLDLPPTPAAALLSRWPEGHALSVYDDDHIERMAAIGSLLPPTLALIGSDYMVQQRSPLSVLRLDERLAQARAAVAKVLEA